MNHLMTVIVSHLKTLKSEPFNDCNSKLFND